MKLYKISVLCVMILLLCTACLGIGQGKNTSIEPEQRYAAQLEALTDQQYYAFLTFEGQTVPLMFVTDTVYEDEQANKVAFYCSHIYDEQDGTVVDLGALSGNGTAYPLSFNGKNLFVAGSHSIIRYEADTESGIILQEAAEETFSADGAVLYRYYTAEEGEQTVADNSALLAMFEQYEQAQPLIFKAKTAE